MGSIAKDTRLRGFTDSSKYASGIIPIWVDAGYRIDPHWYVGGYFQFAFMSNDMSTSASARSQALRCSSIFACASASSWSRDFPSADSASFQGRSLLLLVQSRAPGASREGYSQSLYPRSSFGCVAPTTT